jgi:multidrug resistance efflux pump
MAREFIPNITTANEEIVRLDTALAEFDATKVRLTKAEADLAAAQALLEGAIKPEALQTAKDAQTKAEADLAAANEAHAKAIKELQAKVDAAASDSLKAAAAAGVTPVADTKTTGIDRVDDVKSAASGLTGLARAIAGNAALQADKASK